MHYFKSQKLEFKLPGLFSFGFSSFIFLRNCDEDSSSMKSRVAYGYFTV